MCVPCAMTARALTILVVVCSLGGVLAEDPREPQLGSNLVVVRVASGGTYLLHNASEDGSPPAPGQSRYRKALIPSSGVAWSLGFDPDNATLVDTRAVSHIPGSTVVVDGSRFRHRTLLSSAAPVVQKSMLRFPAHVHAGSFFAVMAWVWLWQAGGDSTDQALLWTSGAATKGELSPALMVGTNDRPNHIVCAALASSRKVGGVVAPEPMPLRQWVHVGLVVDGDVVSW